MQPRDDMSTQLHEAAVDAAVSAAASKTTYAGSAVTVVGWWSSSEVAVAVGMVVGVVGLIVNIIFKIREDRRQQAINEAKLEEIRTRSELRSSLGFGGMPRPPVKPDPVPQPGDEGKE